MLRLSFDHSIYGCNDDSSYTAPFRFISCLTANYKDRSRTPRQEREHGEKISCEMDAYHAIRPNLERSSSWKLNTKKVSFTCFENFEVCFESGGQMAAGCAEIRKYFSGIVYNFGSR